MLTRFDIRPFLWEEDGFVKQPPIDIERYYDEKYQIGYFLQPRSVLEIGVRAGYSAAVWLATGAVKYVGIDANNGEHGGFVGATERASRMLRSKFPAADISLHLMDSQSLISLPWRGIDLAYVDGDHTYNGALHDLDLVLTCQPTWVLVDDVAFIPAVAEAVTDWLALHDFPSMRLSTIRGDVLIRTGNTSLSRTP